jgi:hypothetical protein
MPLIFATRHLNFASGESLLWGFAVAASVKDVAVTCSVMDVAAADTVGDVAVTGIVEDVAAADSVKDVVVLKRTSNEPFSSKLEAGSVKDSGVLMSYMPPLITCFPLSSEAVDVRQ